MLKKKLHVVYIRPSRYDDDGYVIRYWRGVLPSNTLCCLDSLTRAVADRGELGTDVEVTVETIDDTLEKIPVRRIAALNRQKDTRVVVGLTGVQSNQFERASDIAMDFRACGVPVMMGGFHVSGVLALFETPSHELQRLLDAGVTLVKGEVEASGVMTGLLRDALNGEMQPIYDITAFPDLENAPVPMASERMQKRYVSSRMATIDTSRGCPFNCSFCTIINVQGRKMRHRSADCVLRAIEENYAKGISVYFFTDDNFSRNPVWEAILDGMIALRERGCNIGFMMQVDTIAHRIPNFVEKAHRAGCYLAFIGMESVNPKNLEAVGKKQNKVSQYVEMAELWHKFNISIHVGYIIGLPFDTIESVEQDMDLLANQVQVDLASMFMLTPLPGSRDHWQLVKDCRGVDADLNNYDGLHETFKHPLMKPGEWRECYDRAMNLFYSTENIVNVLLRTPASRYYGLFWLHVWYRFSTLEGLHPMATGIYRKKERVSRRSIFPRENIFSFGWRRIKDAVHGFTRYAGLFFEFQEIWMLTRKPEDPRWKTLYDLRMKWLEMRRRVAESDLKGRCDEAGQEVRAMLTTAAQYMRQLSQMGGNMGISARRKLCERANEMEAYVRRIGDHPRWQQVVDAERYISEQVVKGYEELAIQYVAKRRQVNACRKELIQRLKSGHILSLDLCKMIRALIGEAMLTLRFCFFGLSLMMNR